MCPCDIGHTQFHDHYVLNEFYVKLRPKSTVLIQEIRSSNLQGVF